MLVTTVITVFVPLHYSKLMINTQFLFYEEIFIYDIIIDNSFREVVTYSPKKDTMKDVVYFLARAKNFDPTPQAEEIAQVKWVEINLAHSVLTYDNDKQLVNKAKNIIKETV